MTKNKCGKSVCPIAYGLIKSGLAKTFRIENKSTGLGIYGIENNVKYKMKKSSQLGAMGVAMGSLSQEEHNRRVQKRISDLMSFADLEKQLEPNTHRGTKGANKTMFANSTSVYKSSAMKNVDKKTLETVFRTAEEHGYPLSITFPKIKAKPLYEDSQQIIYPTPKGKVKKQQEEAHKSFINN